MTGRGTRQKLASTLGRRKTGGSQGLPEDQAELVKTRVRLLIELTAKSGAYRKGLLKAVDRLSPEEATILSDLAQHGLQVPQLHDVLCGGHVLIDDPSLYEKWHFAKVSHNRISSHHRDIDKKKYPDIGMRGVVVREKLHGRLQQGTWVQLEKTPAAFGKKKLPSMDDVRHLADYVVYRITRSNVGPWGLSRITERRPMYLSPDIAMPTPISGPVADTLASTLRQIEQSDDVTALSADLARRFPPPVSVAPPLELGQALQERAGRGLFGNSPVWVTETSSAPAANMLGRQPDEARVHHRWAEGELS